jgi:hypothetical protein
MIDQAINRIGGRWCQSNPRRHTVNYPDSRRWVETSGLSAQPSATYVLRMTDTPHAPAGWIEAIERGEADLAASRTVPIEDVEQRCRDAITRIKTRKSQAPLPPAQRAG